MNLFGCLRGIIAVGACLIERPGEGSEKKSELKSLVHRVVPDIYDQFEPDFFEAVLDASIDSVVGWLNKSFWKR